MRSRVHAGLHFPPAAAFLSLKNVLDVAIGVRVSRAQGFARQETL
jgi:hypothetical protein